MRVFFWTMEAEWAKLDKYRIDKYLSLVRAFVNQSFQLLMNNSWDPQLTQKVAEVYQTLPLATTKKARVSINSELALHLSDVYLTELGKVFTLAHEEHKVYFWFYFGILLFYLNCRTHHNT